MTPKGFVPMVSGTGTQVFVKEADAEKHARLGFKVEAGGRDTTPDPIQGPSPAMRYVPAPSRECRIPQVLVEFDLSTACTRNCPFCAPGIPKKRRRHPTFLSRERHREVIDALGRANYDSHDRFIIYCGMGEPLMHPYFIEFPAYARKRLPHVKILIYTNGDLLTSRLLSALGAVQAVVVYDNYDDPTGRKVYAAAKASTILPSRVRCQDQVATPLNYSSRTGRVKGYGGKPRREPCGAPSSRLFMSADGKWRLCCEDYGWKTSFIDTPDPVKLNAHPHFARIRDGLRTKERCFFGICSRCDRNLGTYPKYEEYKQLLDIERLKPPVTWPAIRPSYRRLVVMPLSSTSKRTDQLEMAQVVIGAVERRSRVKGKTLLLWNDDKQRQCPGEFRGDPEKRIIWEYNRALGWAGINYGIGEAMRYALNRGYDAVIKMDAADVAIMRDGWDAFLLEDLDPGEMRGFWQETFPEGWPQKCGPVRWPGTYEKQLLELGWAADWAGQGYQKNEYFQGGCYVIGRDAIKAIEDTMGMPTLAEHEIGEDHAFSTRAKVLQIPMRPHPRIMSHFSRSWAYSAPAARYFRDRRGAVVIHPVRRLHFMRQLCEEQP